MEEGGGTERKKQGPNWVGKNRRRSDKEIKSLPQVPTALRGGWELKTLSIITERIVKEAGIGEWFGMGRCEKRPSRGLIVSRFLAPGAILRFCGIRRPRMTKIRGCGPLRAHSGAVVSPLSIPPSRFLRQPLRYKVGEQKPAPWSFHLFTNPIGPDRAVPFPKTYSG